MPHFTEMLDLAAERVGGTVVCANDEFFAPKENLLKAGRGEWIADRYTDRGKWMDGWETRRRRTPGMDWCIVKLGIPGVIRGVEVDTAHFKGNYPEFCSLDACAIDEGADHAGESVAWEEVLARSPLLGDTRNLFPVRDARRWTHVRLSIYPDGGVSRLRVHGEACPDWDKLCAKGGLIDLVAAENGGQAVVANDQFFGSHHNLLLPGRAANMGDGWETQRKRRPGHDWVILRLGTRGVISRVEVDTNHFKGNFPDHCSIEVCDAPGASIDSLLSPKLHWTEVLPQTKLHANEQKHLENVLLPCPPCTHARFRIYPDGGVSRLRLLGTPVGPRGSAIERLNALPREKACSELLKACGSTRWAARVADDRPFRDAETLYEAAEKTWRELHRADWMEAFSAHPKIGDKAQRKNKEQSGVKGAAEKTLAALEKGNRAYEKKNGFIYIVCATGKSADEMLELLKGRLENDRETELSNAANEQSKIIRIRLEKLWAK